MKWYVIVYIMCQFNGAHELCYRIKMPVPFNRYIDCQLMGLPYVHIPADKVSIITCEQRPK